MSLTPASRDEVAALHSFLETLLSELETASSGIKPTVLDKFDAQTGQIDGVWEEQIEARRALSMKLRNG